MKQSVVIIALLFITPYIRAQSELVKPSELIFHSPLEEQTINGFIENDQLDYLALFLCIDPTQTQTELNYAREKYAEALAQLNTAKALKKRSDKKIKIIYQKVHDIFFDQYLEQNLFSEIFINGKYNCVSSTALYGIFFQDLDIPFAIKEKPTHVYLVTYPNSEQILVESTDPLGGYVRFTESGKKELIERLAKAKLIGTNELASMSTEELFRKYYLTDETIDLQSLIGLQYLNNAIYKMNSDKVVEAFQQAQKAWYFYPAKRTENLLLAACLEYLTNQNYTSPNAISYLSQLARFEALDADFFMNEYQRMISILLTDKAEYELLDNNVSALLKAIRNESLKKDITYLYNYERGRVFYNQAKFSQSLPYFEIAYAQSPTNLDIGNILINAIGKTLATISNKEAVHILEKYQEDLPGLLDNNYFRSVLANVYLIEFGRSFELGDEPDGLKYKALFEDYYDPELGIDQNNLGRAYSLSAVYYFRKGYSKKAKQIINQGLNKAPHNHELNTRKRMIN